MQQKYTIALSEANCTICQLTASKDINGSVTVTTLN